MHHNNNTEARYGYNTLASMQAAVARMREFDIPQDAQWGDIDIMERSLDFTVSQTRFGGLPDYVRQLKGEGVRFVTILDPCISTGEPNNTYRPFDLGQELDVWVQLPGEGENCVAAAGPGALYHTVPYCVVYCTVLYCTVLYCRRGPCDGAGVAPGPRLLPRLHAAPRPALVAADGGGVPRPHRVDILVDI